MKVLVKNIRYYDMGDYILVIGNDATDIFKHEVIGTAEEEANKIIAKLKGLNLLKK
jgi:hypothetical protein